jgi:hypothetical protein
MAPGLLLPVLHAVVVLWLDVQVMDAPLQVLLHA